MRAFLPAFALILSAAPAFAQDDDIPPETKAIISKLKDDSKNKAVAVRVSAYKSMGELGEKGKSLRRHLCQGMLDPSPKVQAEAADALKKIDPAMLKLALAVYIDRDEKKIREVAKMGPAAEPLTPLLHAVAIRLLPYATEAKVDFNIIPSEAAYYVSLYVSAMASAAPDDPLVNASVISMLASVLPDLRETAVECTGKIKNKKLALAPVLNIAGSLRDGQRTRVAAINLVPELVDENTKAATLRAIETLRFNGSPAIREAVDAAIAKLKDS